MLVAANPNNRLRESREYLGYAAEEVAVQLGVATEAVLAIEEGAPVDPDALRTLSRLYLRPQGYLLGTDTERPVPSAVERLIAGTPLAPPDRREIERFARFLGDRADAA